LVRRLPRIEIARSEVERFAELLAAGQVVGIEPYRANAMIRALQKRGIQTRTRTVYGITYISAVKTG